jgi:GTP-binding protein
MSTPVGDVTTKATSTPSPQPSSTNEYSFFDEATIYVRAGSGGQGSSTYKKVGKNQDGPPDGGDGGRGGDVVLRVDESMNTLAGLSRYAHRPNAFGGGGAAASANKRRGAAGWVLSFRAENGCDGERQNRRGRNGKSVVVRVPPGTIVQEEVAGEEVPGDDADDAERRRPAIRYLDRGTITRDDPTLVVAAGGAGGDGSGGPADKSPMTRGIRTPRAPPRPGERRRLRLTLKVVADVALVAVPNAGKSTLLGRVTRAKPKIADYPFTTVVPNLGVWVPPYYCSDDNVSDDDDATTDSDNDDGKSLVICDVPGLIAGASEGVGLGHAFLRHVERCHVILHLLDATSSSVLEEYAMINRELLNYGTGKLAAMPQVVVVNKVDAAFGDDDAPYDDDGRFRSREELEGELLKVMPHSRLMWISAKEGDGVDELMGRVAMFVDKVKGAIAADEGKGKTGHQDGDA